MLDEYTLLVLFITMPLQLRAGNQEEEAFSMKDMGVGGVTGLTEVHRHLVDMRK